MGKTDKKEKLAIKEPPVSRIGLRHGLGKQTRGLYEYRDADYGVSHLVIYLKDNCIKNFAHIPRRNIQGERAGEWHVFHYRGATVIIEDKKNLNQAYMAVTSDESSITYNVFNELEGKLLGTR